MLLLRRRWAACRLPRCSWSANRWALKRVSLQIRIGLHFSSSTAYVPHCSTSAARPPLVPPPASHLPPPPQDLVPSFVSILKQITEHRLPRDFDYHRMPAPWIQMRLLRILALLGRADRATRWVGGGVFFVSAFPCVFLVRRRGEGAPRQEWGWPARVVFVMLAPPPALSIPVPSFLSPPPPPYALPAQHGVDVFTFVCHFPTARDVKLDTRTAKPM